MAKDREELCVHYICFGSCEKGRDANHFHYCQKCDQYKPRAKNKHLNKKKQKLKKIRDKEFREYEP